MKRLEIILAIALGMALAAIVGMQVKDAEAATVDTKTRTGLYTRDCAWTSGVVIDCSGGVAYSAQLQSFSRYAVQAIGGKVYLRQTEAASGGADTAVDLYLSTGGWLAISTFNGRRYVSCDGSGDTATLRYMECQ